MKNTLAALLISISMCSCAPLPGNELFDGLKRPTELNEIEDFQIHIDPIATSIECNKLLFSHGQYGLIAMNAVGMAGFVLACADIHGNPDTGLIDRCIIYSSFNSEYFIDHEKRHCMGYQDVLY